MKSRNPILIASEVWTVSDNRDIDDRTYLHVVSNDLWAFYYHETRRRINGKQTVSRQYEFAYVPCVLYKLSSSFPYCPKFCCIQGTHIWESIREVVLELLFYHVLLVPIES